MNKHLKGSLFIILSMLLFSLIGPFVRWIKWDSKVTILITSVIAFLFLLVYLIYKKELGKVIRSRYKLLMIVSGTLVALNILFYYKAFQTTTLANSVLAHYTAPIFAALFAPIYLKEKLRHVFY